MKKNKFLDIEKINPYDNTNEHNKLSESLVSNNVNPSKEKKTESLVISSILKNKIKSDIIGTSFTLTKENFQFIEKLSKTKKINKSQIVNAIIDKIREIDS